MIAIPLRPTRLAALLLCASTALAPAQHPAQHAQQTPARPTPAAPAPSAAAAAPSAAAAPERPLPAAFRNVFYQPNSLAQGSPTLITVEMAQPATHLTGRFLGKPLSFFKSDKPTVWYALAGVDLETPPGTYDLSLAASVPRKGLVRVVRKIDVASANFTSGALEVPENFVKPDDAGKRQIAADSILKNRAYAHLLPTPQWSGDF